MNRYRPWLRSGIQRCCNSPQRHKEHEGKTGQEPNFKNPTPRYHGIFVPGIWFLRFDFIFVFFVPLW
jgi:hypothetical protein